MKTKALSRLFRETLDEVAGARLQADGRSAADDSYRYGLGEKSRHMATLYFVNSLVEAGKQNLRILDIGCGDGLMALLFARLGMDVTTMDITDPPPFGNYGVFLKKTLAEHGISFKKCHLGKEGIPFPDGSFDVVYMGAIIEHLASGHKKAIDDARRVLKEKGIFMIDTANVVHFANRLAFLLGRPVLSPIDDFYNTEDYYGHVREFTTGEMKAMLGYSGFRVMSVAMSNGSIRPTLKYTNWGVITRLRYMAVASLSVTVSTLLPGLRHFVWLAAEKTA